jgi:hypothetical protein
MSVAGSIEATRELCAGLDNLIELAKESHAPIRALSFIERARADLQAYLDEIERTSSAPRAWSSLGAEGEEMSAARLKELEEMAAKLLETARKLPSGQDRHSALQEIERFRARITAQQRLDLRSAQSPQPHDVVTRPCTIHAGRFRSDIRENGRPIKPSMESFATEQEAHADGRRKLEKLLQVSRL